MKQDNRVKPDARTECDSTGSRAAQCSASGVEAETWHEWMTKQYATLDLNKAEDMGMFLAFALVETRLRIIGQYTTCQAEPCGPETISTCNQIKL